MPTGPTSGLAQLIHESVASMDRLTPETYGVGRGNLISPRKENPARHEVVALAQSLGVSVGDFYVGGKDAAQIAAISSSAWNVPTPSSPSRARRCKSGDAGVIG